MKFLLFALIAVVAAEPEADSDSLYPFYSPYSTLRTPYTTGLYSPYRYSAGVLPYRSAYYSGIYKREAEAESDPELVYTNGKFHTNARNLAKGVHTQYAGPGSLYQSIFPYSQGTTYSAYNAHAVAGFPYRSAYYSGIYKREAEAEPEAESDSLYPFYSPYNTLRTPYTAGLYSPYRYSAGVLPYRSAYYSGIYKREAEAESDSYYPYSSIYRTPYTAGVYNNIYSPYRNVYNTPISSVYPRYYL